MPTCTLINGIRIEIRIRENGHNIPHVHAKKGDNDVSIALDGYILAGNFKSKKDKDTVLQWITTNKEYLMNKWKELH